MLDNPLPKITLYEVLYDGESSFYIMKNAADQKPVPAGRWGWTEMNGRSARDLITEAITETLKAVGYTVDHKIYQADGYLTDENNEPFTNFLDATELLDSQTSDVGEDAITSLSRVKS